MKASQYLYTSYKNSPNGGYAIYSMSNDISQEDAKVIFLLMQYPAVPMLSDTRRKLNNMTWNPVEMKDIEGVCPRNFAYFKLPSGKFCIAEAGYIGPEFKGFTPSGRTGNYLIHALVCDAFDKLPILYLGSKTFRHDLSLEEWTCKTPAPLGEVEVSSEGGFSQAEISSFLTSNGRKEHLAKIVTALKDKNNKLPVYINDEIENARLWISAISLLLTKDELANLTFNTYSYDDNNVKLGLPECSKYRVQFITGSSARMKLQQKLFTGLVIDLVNNQFSQNLTVDDVVSYEVACLEKDIFSAAPFAATIERIKSTFGVDNQTALKINKLEKEGVDNFSALELLQLLSIYSKSSDIKNYCLNVFNNLLSGKYGLGDDMIKLGNFLLPYLDEANRIKYTHFVFDPYLSKVSQDTNAFINETKSRFAAIYKEFAHILPIEKEGKDLLLANENNRALVFLYLDSLLSDVTYNVHDNFVSLNEIIMHLSSKGYSQGDINYSLLLVSKVSAYLPNLKSDFYKSIVEKIDITSTSELLKYLPEVNDINFVANKLYGMIMKNDNKKEVLTLYRNFLSSYPNFARIDGSISTRPEVISIIEGVEKQDFASLSIHTNDSLLSFYRKYYVSGNDKEGLFIGALNKKLQTSRSYDDIAFWLNTFLATPLKEEDKSIYSSLLNSLIGIAGSNLPKYRNEINALKRLGAVRSDVEVEMFANDLFKKNESMLRNELMTSSLYTSLFNGVDDENKKSIFAKKHLCKIVATILKFKTVSFYEDAALLNNAVMPFVNDEAYVKDLYNLMNIERIDDEKYVVMLYCAYRRQEAFSIIAEKIFNKINSLMSQKQKDHLANYILKNVRQDKDPKVYVELMGIAEKLNPKKVKDEVVKPANKPDVSNVNNTTGVTTPPPGVENKSENKKEGNESKGFFHNLFHKK